MLVVDVIKKVREIIKTEVPGVALGSILTDSSVRVAEGKCNQMLKEGGVLDYHIKITNLRDEVKVELIEGKPPKEEVVYVRQM